jgi:hypothetical protein
MLRVTRLVALATLWLVPLCIFTVAFKGGWLSTWRGLRLPSAVPHFVDLYSIPAAVETMHSGGDPLIANPADPKHRPMNYPRIWLYLFSAARITTSNISIVALIFCGLYLSCMSYLIVQAKRTVDVVILLIATVSLAPLLAMERGNNDMFVFTIAFLGCVATNQYLKSGAFGIGALLKIYPMAAMMLDTLRRPAKRRQVAMLLTGIVIVLFALQWHDLLLIGQNTPISRWTSYGVISLREEILFGGLQWGILVGLGWIIVLECWIAGALAIGRGWKNPWDMSGPDVNPMYLEMFTAFGAMYVFTYAIGSNSGYRLILLLPTLPLALDMARNSSHRLWAIIYVALVVLAENTVGFEQNGGTETGHLATFSLFLIILAFLAGQSRKHLVRNETPELATA